MYPFCNYLLTLKNLNETYFINKIYFYTVIPLLYDVKICAVNKEATQLQ